MGQGVVRSQLRHHDNGQLPTPRAPRSRTRAVCPLALIAVNLSDHRSSWSNQMASPNAQVAAIPSPQDFSEAEWRMRVDLAACYRLAEVYGMSKVIWNHITARIPAQPQSILAFRMGHRYDEVT